MHVADIFLPFSHSQRCYNTQKCRFVGQISPRVSNLSDNVLYKHTQTFKALVFYTYTNDHGVPRHRLIPHFVHH